MLKPILLSSLFVTQLVIGQVSKVSVNNHVLAVCSNSLFSWGNNQKGQLGVVTANPWSNNALLVPTIANVKDVCVGAEHSMVLDNSGNLWTFGGNANGQLGDGTNTNKTTPAIIASLGNVISISTQHVHSLALKSDSTVWAWGSNLNGELGDGTTISKNTPIQVPGLTGVAYIKAGYYCSFAIKADGTLWAWGSNGGKLGDGTSISRKSPVQINVYNPAEIACGTNHTLIRDSMGAILACGSNGFNQFGNGTSTSTNVPTYIGAGGFKSISAGNDLSVGVKNNGTVMTWGLSTQGGLGLGASVTSTNVPTFVSGINNVVSIGNHAHNIAFVIKNDGTLWGWGQNTQGQFADGTNNAKYTPFKINNPCGGVGIKENQVSEAAWTIFPNPTAGPFNITIETELENASFEIVNTLGQTILSQPLKSEFINLPESLNNGIYFILLKQNGQRIGTKKLVIEK